MCFQEIQVKLEIKGKAALTFPIQTQHFPSCLIPSRLTICQTQRNTHILILCNQTGREDLGSPKSPTLDRPREGEDAQVKKGCFCDRELSPQALSLPRPMASTIGPPRYTPPSLASRNKGAKWDTVSLMPLWGQGQETGMKSRSCKDQGFSLLQTRMLLQDVNSF